jgi:hypothetical protein
MAGMLASAIKQKFPKAEVIDGAATAENELRGKLTKTFALITLLDANAHLLPLVAQPVPLKLEGANLRWGDYTAPLKDLHVDFVGRNPYGVGYSIVIAAGSFNAISGGDEGNYSYANRNADGILRCGTYDEEFTPTPRGRLTLADARADEREFFATLERIHASLYARITEQDYRRMKEETLAAVDARAGADGRVSIEDLAYLLRYSAAFIRDAHTEVLNAARPNQEPLDHSQFLPFRFEFENGRYYITGAKDASLVGMELTAVNGAPTVEFFRPALDRIAGEIMTWRGSRLAGSQQFWLWFTNVVGKTAGCCRLALRDAGGAEVSRTVEPINLAEYGRIQVTAARKMPAHNGTQLHFLDGGKVAQFIYPAFQASPGEMKKIDDVFRQIRESKSEDVIVDLRGNGGGEILMGGLIYSYLTPVEVKQFQGGRMKISPEAMQDILGRIFLQRAGEVLTVTDTNAFARELAGAFALMNAQMPKRDPFRGRVWLLVDHRTFSAANIFTVAFQEYKVGKVLGYETGQPANICGDPVISFTLKHSGIPYRVSASEGFFTRPTPGAAEHGVLPDVTFDRKLLAPFRGEADPELALTLDYIRKHR